MKLSTLFIFGIFSMLSLTSISQVTISSVTFSSTPTDCDSTYVTVSGLQMCANYAFTGSSFSVSGSTITVSLDYLVGFICLPAIVSYSQPVNLGLLSAGTYSVNVVTYLNSTVSNTSTGNSLSVTSCCSANPSFTLSDDTVCIGETVSATNTSTGTTSTVWYLDGVQYSTSTNTTLVFVDAGVYELKLSGTNGSCTDSVGQTIYVGDYPVVELGNDTSICQGSFVAFSGPTGLNGYLWSTGATGYLINATDTGLYTLIGTNIYGCSDTDSVQILSLYPLPEPDLGSDVQKCPGDSITLSTTNSWGTYLWSNAETSASITVNTGTFWVKVLGSNGCHGRDTINVSDHQLDTVGLANDSNVCGQTKMYTSAFFAGYLWSNGQTLDTVTVDSSDTYFVTVTDANGCEQIDTLPVVIFEIPHPDLGNDQQLCGGQSITLQTGTSGNHVWNDGSTGTTLVVTQLGTYSVSVTSDEMCTGSDTVKIQKCVGIDEVNNDFDVYPNPAKDFIQIRQNSIGSARMYLYNVHGALVRQELVSTSLYSIDISDLPSGLYMLMLTEAGHEQTLTKKVIID